MTRAEALRGAIAGGALLGAAGAGLGGVATAAAAGVPDVDLAHLRLLVGAELLKTDLETRALSSGKLGAAGARLLRRMRADDNSHYSGLAVLLTGAGQTPAAASDIDFSYPRRSFSSQEAIVRLAWTVASISLGAYLGAVESVETARIRLPLGQIAANEAQQLSALAPLVGRQAVGRAFAVALPIDAVSAALDRYEA